MALDLDFDALQRDLYTGVICDVLDSLGLRNQAMQADIRPVHPEMTLAGRARTVLSVDVYHVPENCYEREISFVDALLPGDVAVGCTNRSTRTGLWGELLSTASRRGDQPNDRPLAARYRWFPRPRALRR